jgi:hypothetical protein
VFNGSQEGRLGKGVGKPPRRGPGSESHSSFSARLASVTKEVAASSGRLQDVVAARRARQTKRYKGGRELLRQLQVAPARYCSPRHRMPYDYMDEGSKPVIWFSGHWACQTLLTTSQDAIDSRDEDSACRWGLADTTRHA